MRIFHLADLHIGKIVNGFSMIDQQVYILDQIINLIKKYQPEVIMIAGDVYDKRNPSNESVRVFNNFLTKLSTFDLDILIISGNHDSGDKLQFLSTVLKKQRIHIVGNFKETIKKVKINDNYGHINFYLMPFVRPSDVRMYIDDVDSYHSAIEKAISHTSIDWSQRNIFIGHQFFASSQQELERSDSELISVGGIDNVGYNLLSNFDYAALGHLHKAQQIRHDYIRYSGSPLKYSDSEVNHKKSIVMLDIMEKDNYSIELLQLKPQLEMRAIKGYLEDILKVDYDLENLNDYVHITLLDDGEIIDAIGKLRNKYPNLMSLKFDNIKSQTDSQINVVEDISDTDPIKLFKDFFKLQNNKNLNDNQIKIINKLMKKEEI